MPRRGNRQQAQGRGGRHHGRTSRVQRATPVPSQAATVGAVYNEYGERLPLNLLEESLDALAGEMDQVLEQSQEIPMVSVETEVSGNDISGISGLSRELDRVVLPVRPSSDGRGNQGSAGGSMVARDPDVAMDGDGTHVGVMSENAQPSAAPQVRDLQ
jgi:hypothetical protein